MELEVFPRGGSRNCVQYEGGQYLKTTFSVRVGRCDHRQESVTKTNNKQSFEKRLEIPSPNLQFLLEVSVSSVD